MKASEWRRLWRGLGVAGSMIGLLAWAPSAEAGYLNGYEYQALSESERTAVVMGLWDAMEFLFGDIRAIVDGGSVAHIDRLIACTSSLSSSDLRQIFDDYYAANPDAGQYSLGSSFDAALQWGCP